MLRPHTSNQRSRSVKFHLERLEDRLAPAVLAQSTFDAGDEGWRVGHFFDNDGAIVPTFVSSDGNPGGFIRTTDAANIAAFQAPAAFLGDRSAAYGGVLHVEERLLTSDGANYPVAALANDTLFLQFRMPPPGTSWTAFDLPLIASAGWEIIDPANPTPSGPLATEEQLRAVLGNLTLLNIFADWHTGADQVDVDNVRLETPPPPESTFDADDDGWRIGEFFSNAGDTAPTYLDSGGNPGGFIRTTDIFGVVAFQAPATLLGNQSAYYGGTLHLEQRLLAANGPHYPMVLLSDGTQFLQFRTPPPTTDWTPYEIPLVASAGWEVSNLSDTADADPPASEEQLQQVLGNLTLFNLRADWNSGADRVDLDNVRFVEPAAAPTTDLEVTISASPDPVFVGDPLTYTVTVTNHGRAKATGVVVSASGPDDLEFNSVVVPVGALPAGASRSFELIFTPTEEGAFLVHATVSGDQTDPSPDNNTFIASANVLPRPPVDLSVSITGPAEAFVGDQGVFTVTITNHGPITAHNISLKTSELPLGMYGTPSGVLTVSGDSTNYGMVSVGVGRTLFTYPDIRSYVGGTLAPLAPGSSAVVTIPVRFTGAVVAVGVDVSTSQGDPHLDNNHAHAQTQVTQVIFQLDASQYSVLESAGALPVTIVRTGSTVPMKVRLYGDNETASFGVNYAEEVFTINFAQDQMTATLAFPILDDEKVTGDQTFRLRLMRVGPPDLFGTGFADPSSATVTIIDTTAPPTIELADAQYAFSEGEVFAVVSVRRTGAPADSSSVEFTTINGTAIAPFTKKGAVQADYQTTSGTLFFGPRQNVATIRVPILDDNHIEGDETFRVVLSDPSPGAVLGENTSAEIIIHDNDPSVSFAASSSTTRESGLKEIAVRLSAPISRKVSVNWAVDGGTATAGIDYRPQAGVVTFRPGETRQTITLRIVGDTVYEGDETLTLKLSAPVNAFLGQRLSHRLTIQDDDPVPPPADPGGTRETALPIDLQTVPRQYYEQRIRSGDWDMFKVHLSAGEYLALDVDPFGSAGVESSRMDIFAAQGDAPLATIGASREPETNKVTDNPAHLFRAPESGAYYILLRASSLANRNYRLHFHRIGVSEEVPRPELLDIPGPMYAWFDGEDTVGITGPTGYGFTLIGDWIQDLTKHASGLVSQKLTLDPGSQFTLKSPQVGELSLIANGNIEINTRKDRWGNIVGVVATEYIKFPVSLALTKINDFLANAFGAEVSVGALSGDWRISLGGKARFYLGMNQTAPIDQMLAGVPYLRHVGLLDALTVEAFGFTVGHLPGIAPIDWVLDPADPMLYIRVDTAVGPIDKPGLALSKHGLLEYRPMDAPNPALDAGATHIFGHVFTAGKIKFQAGPVPLEIDAETVINLDADRDGRILGDLSDLGQLAGIIAGDVSEYAEILSDIQLGSNGKLNFRYDILSHELVALQKWPEFTIYQIRFPLGRSSLVYNGLRGSFWLRGETVNPFAGTPLHELVSTGSVVEGMLNLDGDIFLSLAILYPVGPGAHLILDFTLTNHGISAQITGKLEWSAKIDTPVGSVSGKAIAQFTGGVDISFDSAGRPRWNGSITATGKLKYKSKTLFTGALEAAVRSIGLRFKFPKGVGSLDFDLFA